MPAGYVCQSQKYVARAVGLDNAEIAERSGKAIRTEIRNIYIESMRVILAILTRQFAENGEVECSWLNAESFAVNLDPQIQQSVADSISA